MTCYLASQCGGQHQSEHSQPPSCHGLGHRQRVKPRWMKGNPHSRALEFPSTYCSEFLCLALPFPPGVAWAFGPPSELSVSMATSPSPPTLKLELVQNDGLGPEDVGPASLWTHLAPPRLGTWQEVSCLLGHLHHRQHPWGSL